MNVKNWKKIIKIKRERKIGFWKKRQIRKKRVFIIFKLILCQNNDLLINFIVSLLILSRKKVDVFIQLDLSKSLNR